MYHSCMMLTCFQTLSFIAEDEFFQLRGAVSDIMPHINEQLAQRGLHQARAMLSSTAHECETRLSLTGFRDEARR